MEECIEVSHERMLGSSQNCHKDWRITVDNCHSLGCSVSELPLGNFSPFEALWVSLHRRWTFQILSFPHPMQLGACMWLRLGQAGPHAKNIKLRANDTKKHRPQKKKKKSLLVLWAAISRPSFHRQWCQRSQGSSQSQGQDAGREGCSVGTTAIQPQKTCSRVWFELVSAG